MPSCQALLKMLINTYLSDILVLEWVTELSWQFLNNMSMMPFDELSLSRARSPFVSNFYTKTRTPTNYRPLANSTSLIDVGNTKNIYNPARQVWITLATDIKLQYHIYSLYSIIGIRSLIRCLAVEVLILFWKLNAFIKQQFLEVYYAYCISIY